MYVPEKGKKPPVGAVELELCALLRLEARSARSNKATITSRLSRVGPPGGDKSLFTEESLLLKAVLASSLGKGTSRVNRTRFLPLAMIDTVTSRFFFGREIYLL